MKRTKIKNCYKMPNVIINDQQLTYSAKVVAAVIYGNSNVMGFCRLGLRRVAQLAHCSQTTAAHAVKQLREAGYIDAYQNYGWSNNVGRIVYKNYTYVCRISVQKDFTFIPRLALGKKIKKSSFVLYLHLRKVAGNALRAFPSLSAICDALCMAKATVCRAIIDLANSNLIHLEHCVKTNGAYTSNSYFFIQDDLRQDTQGIDSKPTESGIHVTTNMLDALLDLIIGSSIPESNPKLPMEVVSFLVN